MATWKKITLHQNLLSKYFNKRNEIDWLVVGEDPKKGLYIECEGCGQPLYVGDKAWAHLCPRKRESHTVYYGLMCYRNLFV